MAKSNRENKPAPRRSSRDCSKAATQAISSIILLGSVAIATALSSTSRPATRSAVNQKTNSTAASTTHRLSSQGKIVSIKASDGQKAKTNKKNNVNTYYLDNEERQKAGLQLGQLIMGFIAVAAISYVNHWKGYVKWVEVSTPSELNKNKTKWMLVECEAEDEDAQFITGVAFSKASSVIKRLSAETNDGTAMINFGRKTMHKVSQLKDKFEHDLNMRPVRTLSQQNGSAMNVGRHDLNKLRLGGKNAAETVYDHLTFVYVHPYCANPDMHAKIAHNAVNNSADWTSKSVWNNYA